MEARLLRAAILVATICCLGASHRTRNFMATAATPDLAREVCEEAERFRRELAVEWLGQELPPWPAPCPIRVKVGPRLGAGGATSFAFEGNYPMHWQMEVYGSRERVLDSVLPHEVMHTVFATHFGQPLPRWADEGACTTVEHDSERAKHKKMLIHFLKNGKGIPFNRMFAMKEYPPDMLPLYAQGYSVARYLIEQGGRPKFVRFVGEGLQTNRWDAAVRNHYGFKDLSELQLTWVDWVADGSPPLQEGQVLDALVQEGSNATNNLQSPDSRPTGRSWYAEQRDLAQRRRAAGERSTNQDLKPPIEDNGRRELMEWREGQPLPDALPTARPRALPGALAPVSAARGTVWR